MYIRSLCTNVVLTFTFKLYVCMKHSRTNTRGSNNCSHHNTCTFIIYTGTYLVYIPISAIRIHLYPIYIYILKALFITAQLFSKAQLRERTHIFPLYKSHESLIYFNTLLYRYYKFNKVGLDIYMYGLKFRKTIFLFFCCNNYLHNVQRSLQYIA